MKSIAFRLWIYIIALILVILGTLWFLQTGLLNTFYVNRETDNIKRDINIVATLESLQDLNKMSSNIEVLSKNYNAMVDVIDSEGRIITTSGRVMRGRVASIEAEELPNVLSGQERVINEDRTMSGMQLVSVGVPIKYNNSIVGAIFLHMPSSSIKETVSILQNQFFIVTIIAILIATLGAFILSKGFTGPILKINNAALQISKGRLDTRVDIKYRDEIGRLGDTINNMASELSKVENLRKDLVANISHEFRTPLSIIKSYGEGLMDKVYTDENEKDEYIRIILDETGRLSRLVDDVLDISKLQSGVIKIDIISFNLSSLIKRAHDKFKVLCQEKDVGLFSKCPEEVYVMGDEARIEQVMLNLLNNSLNHTEPGGNINIDVSVNGEITVIVADTGKGIPKEDLPYIFDRFYKVDKSGKKSSAGTGLGLAIVKEILKGHNSKFNVESEVGNGTRFFFSLEKA